MNQAGNDPYQDLEIRRPGAMGEGTDYTSFDSKASSKRKLTIAVAGAAVALLVAGVLFQVLRAQTGGAADIRGNSPGGDAGVATTGSLDGSRPAAVVNDERIARDTVKDACLERYGPEILDNLINRTIIQQDCERQGIRVTPQDVHKEVVRIAKTFGLEVDVWYQMLGAERNITPLQYQRDIIWPMLALKKLVNVQEKLDPEDVRKAFTRDYGKRVKARIILLDNERQALAVWTEADKLCTAARENSKLDDLPEEFGRLARKHSVDPNSRAMGGKIPAIRQYAGNDELAKVAFSLKMGEISRIIHVGVSQYVFLLCEGWTDPVVVDFKEVEEDLKEQLREEKRQQAIASKFKELKDEANIINYLVYSKKEGIPPNSGTGNSGSARTADGRRTSKGVPRSDSTGRSGPIGNRLKGVPGLGRPRTN